MADNIPCFRQIEEAKNAQIRDYLIERPFYKDESAYRSTDGRCYETIPICSKDLTDIDSYLTGVMRVNDTRHAFYFDDHKFGSCNDGKRPGDSVCGEEFSKYTQTTNGPQNLKGFYAMNRFEYLNHQPQEHAVQPFNRFIDSRTSERDSRDNCPPQSYPPF